MTLRCSSLFLFAGVAFGSAIQVTGFGSFGLDNFHDTYANVCLFGEGIQVCANGVPIGPAPPEFLYGSSLITPQMSYSSATVDGMTSNHYSLSLGGYGPQYVRILDQLGNVLASEEISGVIEITSYEQFGGTRLNQDGSYINTNWWARGTFAVVQPNLAAAVTPAPEAPTVALVGLGILGVFGRLKRSTGPERD